MLNVDFVFLLLSTAYGHAARMSTPGPIMSGFKIPGLSKLGPLEEKSASWGAYGTPKTVPLKSIVAIGDDVEFI
jgi:hypothetical protein